MFQMVTYTVTQKYGDPGGTTALKESVPLGPIGQAVRDISNVVPQVKTVYERYMGPRNPVQSLGERRPQQQAQWGARANTVQVGSQGRDYWAGTPVGSAAKVTTRAGQIVYNFAFGKGKR